MTIRSAAAGGATSRPSPTRAAAGPPPGPPPPVARAAGLPPRPARVGGGDPLPAAPDLRQLQQEDVADPLVPPRDVDREPRGQPARDLPPRRHRGRAPEG